MTELENDEPQLVQWDCIEETDNYILSPSHIDSMGYVAVNKNTSMVEVRVMALAEAMAWVVAAEKNLVKATKELKALKRQQETAASVKGGGDNVIQLN